MSETRRSDPGPPGSVGPGSPASPSAAARAPLPGRAGGGWRTIAGIAVLLAACFALDLATPLGFAAATSYLFPVFLTLWVRQPGLTIGVSALGVSLAIAGYFLSSGLDVPRAAVLFNRLGSILAIVLTAVLVVWRIRLLEAIRESEHRFHTVLERASMLAFSQDHRLRYTWVYCPQLPNALDLVVGRTDQELGHLKPLAPVRSPDKSVVIRDGRTLRQEVALDSPSGPLIWDLAICPYVDSRGRITGLVGVAVDVTEHRRLLEQRYRKERLEGIERLAGGIAHQFNNRLTIVLATLHLLTRGLSADDPRREDFEGIERAIAYLGDLTHQLHAFSGRVPLRRRSIDLNRFLRDLQRREDLLAGNVIEVTLALDPDLWPVMADPPRLEEAVLRLVERACRAMPEGGSLGLETRNEVRPQGDMVALEIRDTGVPVSPEAIDGLFEPFGARGPHSADPGLHLAACHGLIRRHGGTLDVQVSAEGSAFIVRLPRADRPARAAPRPRRTPVPSGRETILLAEDDRPLNDVLARLLRRVGYEVVTVPDGEEALAQLDRLGTDVDLLVSDIVMPGMLGSDLAREVRARLPDLPILLMSGYGETQELPAGVEFLEKPFVPDVFLEWVRTSLRRQPA